MKRWSWHRVRGLSTLLRAVVTILKEELMREVPAANAIIRHCSSAVTQQTFNVFNGNCIFFFFFLVQPCHFVYCEEKGGGEEGLLPREIESITDNSWWNFAGNIVCTICFILCFNKFRVELKLNRNLRLCGEERKKVRFKLRYFINSNYLWCNG